ncbi:glycosyltransferase family 25 protein [Nitratireductor sp. GCM10026969]|uniref:glycosyltransferase family 25 protein n=1 Tax=Nitratireductor sp. GCM10026969 TaxID=3252645 RepID=UPI0036182E77
MKLFLINLDRQPERLRRMTSLFEELGLSFTRVAAVDGARLSGAEIERWRGARALRAGETACFLSHRECWRRIIDEGLSQAAIFEDDLHVGAGASALLADGDWVPEDADVVKIETKLQRARVDKAPAGAVGDRRLHRLRSRHAGAGGYIVTRKGAEKLLRMCARFDSPVDQFIFDPALPSAASLVIYQLLPAVCVQDFVVREPEVALGLGSDLHGERVEDKPRGTAKAWREVKRPFVQLGGLFWRPLSAAVSDRKWVFVTFT